MFLRKNNSWSLNRKKKSNLFLENVAFILFEPHCQLLSPLGCFVVITKCSEVLLCHRPFVRLQILSPERCSYSRAPSMRSLRSAQWKRDGSTSPILSTIIQPECTLLPGATLPQFYESASAAAAAVVKTNWASWGKYEVSLRVSDGENCQFPKLRRAREKKIMPHVHGSCIIL